MINRHQTIAVDVGGVGIGGNNPIRVQSMTNTDTEDVHATVAQIIELFEAGSEIVRITVPTAKAAKAVSEIKQQLVEQNCNVPLVGCFHYNGHKLLNEVPECAKALDKFRINPGNADRDETDINFDSFINLAIKYNKPIRIGVNWGSLDQRLIKKIMDDNQRLSSPRGSDELVREALVLSALNSAKRAEHLGLAANKIVISCKVSNVPDLIVVYEELAKRSNYALHLGLTEAGSGVKGIVSSTIGIGVLLQKGIGDTIRVSVTQEPGEARSLEVKVCCEILQALGARAFTPQITSCPGCGRTDTELFQGLVSRVNQFVHKNSKSWSQLYPGFEKIKIAVMGCIVNGPGESKHADIGISFPGRGEVPSAVIYADGNKFAVLRDQPGLSIADQFEKILEEYIKNKTS